MNKNSKKRQCRDLENEWYLGCGVNPKDVLSHDYLSGDFSDPLMMIYCTSVNIQDGSNLANLKERPQVLLQAAWGDSTGRMVWRCVVHAALWGHQQEQRLQC